MRTPGIHNPFKPPTPKTVDTPATALTLDGDSYTLTLENTTMDTVPERLFSLLYEVSALYSSHLKTYGIYAVKNKEQLPSPQDRLTLRTKHGFISVYCTTMKEDEIFRRIGHALSQLPIKSLGPLLKKQGVTITQRS
jgi:hypothetical protein